MSGRTKSDRYQCLFLTPFLLRACSTIPIPVAKIYKAQLALLSSAFPKTSTGGASELFHERHSAVHHNPHHKSRPVSFQGGLLSACHAWSGRLNMLRRPVGRDLNYFQTISTIEKETS